MLTVQNASGVGPDVRWSYCFCRHDEIESALVGLACQSFAPRDRCCTTMPSVVKKGGLMNEKKTHKDLECDMFCFDACVCGDKEDSTVCDDVHESI